MAKASTLFSSVSMPSLRMINVVLRYEGYCPSLKKVNIFTVGSKKNFKQFPFAWKRVPQLLFIISLFTSHMCMWRTK